METAYPVMAPVEKLLQGVLAPIKDDIPDLTVLPYIENQATFSTPYLEHRKEPGAWTSSSFAGGDYRFVRRVLVSVNTFTDDRMDGNGDERGAALQEIAFQRIMGAWRNQVVIPGAGSISRVALPSPPHYVNNWATGTQVVRYASLPKGVIRYEATYGLEIAPDQSNPPDLLALFR